MEKLFFWQLIGDVLKIASWLFAFVMLAKSMTKLYIITEVIFAVSFYGLSVLMIEQNGLQGVTIAHALNYLIYFVVMARAMARSMS